MERNTKTTLAALEIGDRFYLCKDKKRTVWEKVENTKVKSSYALIKQDTMKYAQMFRLESEVIFLRHKNQ